MTVASCWHRDASARLECRACRHRILEAFSEAQNACSLRPTRIRYYFERLYLIHSVQREVQKGSIVDLVVGDGSTMLFAPSQTYTLHNLLSCSA